MLRDTAQRRENIAEAGTEIAEEARPDLREEDSLDQSQV